MFWWGGTNPPDGSDGRCRPLCFAGEDAGANLTAGPLPVDGVTAAHFSTAKWKYVIPCHIRHTKHRICIASHGSFSQGCCETMPVPLVLSLNAFPTPFASSSASARACTSVCWSDPQLTGNCPSSAGPSASAQGWLHVVVVHQADDDCLNLSQNLLLVAIYLFCPWPVHLCRAPPPAPLSVESALSAEVQVP